jgi:signal transduction histidine kinase
MTPEQFLDLADLIPEPLFMIAADGRLLAANRAACSVLGLQRRHAGGQPFEQFLGSDPEELRRYLRLCSGSKQPLAGGIVLTGVDGGEMQYRCDGAVLSAASPDSSAVIVLRCIPREHSNTQFVLLNRKIDELNHEIMQHQRAEEQVRRLNEELEARIGERTLELQNAYRDLESFSYSVSHDLRSPLRSINGFSRALLEDYADQLDATGRDFLRRVCNNTHRMGELIDDILEFSRIGRCPIQRETVALSDLCGEIVRQLRELEPHRQVEVGIAPDVRAQGDLRLMQILLDNLLNNAWKYTGKQQAARIEFGELHHNQERVYFVRDNGAGFDMRYANKLFGAFQRLHAMDEYEGNGIGLATVQRIVHRHGGRVWAEARVDEGATFYFTVSEQGH